MKPAFSINCPQMVGADGTTRTRSLVISLVDINNGAGSQFLDSLAALAALMSVAGVTVPVAPEAPAPAPAPVSPQTQLPEFPGGFVERHCPRVQTARRSWRREQADPADFVAREHAECAFERRGAGMKCMTCQLFLTRPFAGHPVDEEWLPQIEAYYAAHNAAAT